MFNETILRPCQQSTDQQRDKQIHKKLNSYLVTRVEVTITVVWPINTIKIQNNPNSDTKPKNDD